MPLNLPGNKLVIASHNAGKVREISDLLRPLGLDVSSAAQFGLAEPAETEQTFEGNARLKAEAAQNGSGLAALSDDSGLCVEALDGAPGIFSARWAGSDRNFSRAMETVQRELQAVGALHPDQRRAYFVCALCLSIPEAEPMTFVGKVHGHIVWPPRGDRGFGYDPIFQADGHDKTFGEMDPGDKHAISHRAVAFAKLVAALEE